MMKNLSTILLLIIVSQTHANFKNLAMEWDKQNINILEQRSRVDLKTFDFEKVELQKTWNLNYEYNFADSDKESNPSSIIPASSNSDSHTISLAKDFYWGGSFSFNNYITSTEYNSSSVTSQYYQFNQGVTYSQSLGADFLGRNYRKEKIIAGENVHLAKLEYDEKREEGLYNLLRQYTIASLTKSLITFQKQAKSRADKRLNLIKKWVRDGLRERVDLYQAQAAALAAEENVKLAKIDLSKSIQNLSTALHRGVTASEVAQLNNNKIDLNQFDSAQDNNKNVKVLQSRMRIYNEKLKQAENGVMPTVLLTLGWNSNDYDVQRSETFSKGKIGQEHDEKSVSVAVSWPLGSLSKKVEKEQATINLNLAQKRYEKYNQDLIQIRASLKTQLSTLEINISSIKNRIALNKKSLKEYNRLYNRGRADLDQVIRAEETLINSEISLIRQIAEFKQKLGELNYLNGTLISSVLGK